MRPLIKGDTDRDNIGVTLALGGFIGAIAWAVIITKAVSWLIAVLR